MAYASKAPLTAENYAAARAEMQIFRGDSGCILGTNAPDRAFLAGQKN